LETEETAPKIIIDFELDQESSRTTCQDRVPLLFVDVNMGKNLSERIVIHDHDTSYSLARDFCSKHEITDFKKMKQLQQML
jgi:hypothetical protein